MLLLGSCTHLLDLVAFLAIDFLCYNFPFSFRDFHGRPVFSPGIDILLSIHYPLPSWHVQTSEKTLSGIWHSTQCLINAINFISSLLVQIGKIWHAVMQAWHCPQQRPLFNTKSSRKDWNNLVSLKAPLRERGKKKKWQFSWRCLILWTHQRSLYFENKTSHYKVFETLALNQ